MFLKRLNPLIYPTESTRSSGETETKPKVEARGEAEESIKKVFILNKVGVINPRRYVQFCPIYPLK